MAVALRDASRVDIPAMQRIRGAVRENRLVSIVFDEESYAEAIERSGRGWVVVADGETVAFAVANVRTGNIWALFVDPAHEGCGHGRLLHDAMVAWLWSRGLDRIWLTTAPATRAEQFYRRAGWRSAGRSDDGEIRFEMDRPTEGGTAI